MAKLISRLDEMTEIQRECAQLIFLLTNGQHNFRGNFYCNGENSLKVTCKYLNLSTFDNNKLTKLVFLAHDMCIRVEIDSISKNGITIKNRHNKLIYDLVIHHFFLKKN
jgi:hypothetical protein